MAEGQCKQWYVQTTGAIAQCPNSATHASRQTGKPIACGVHARSYDLPIEEEGR